MKYKFIIFLAFITLLACYSNIATAASNEYLYVGHPDTGMLTVVDTYSDLMVNSSPIPFNIQGICASPAGDYIIASDWTNRQVLFIQPLTNTILFSIPVNGRPYDLTVSNDGKTVYVPLYYSWDGVNSGPGDQVAVIDVPSKSVSAYINLDYDPVYFPFHYPRKVLLSSDNTKLYVLEDNLSVGTAAVGMYDLSTYTRISNKLVNQNPTDMVLSPSGSKLYIISNYNDFSQNGTLRIFNATNMDFIKDVGLDKFPYSIAFNKANNAYYITSVTAASMTAWITKYNYPADTVNTRIGIAIDVSNSQDYPFKVAVSDLGAVYVGHGNKISIYDAITNANIATISPNHGMPYYMAFIIPSVESAYYKTAQPYKIVIQSAFGLFKYNNVSVHVYDLNGVYKTGGVTDDNGVASVTMSTDDTYDIIAIGNEDNINKTIRITTSPYDSTYYISVSPFLPDWNPLGWLQGVDAWTGIGTGDVNKDVRVNYSVDRSVSPRVVLLNYSDATASTTSINFTLLKHWQNNGTYTIYNTTIIAGVGMSYRQLPVSVPASLADGESYRIVVTSETGAYGTVYRYDNYHFPGITYPLPGLPESWYPYIAYGVIILFGLFFTYVSAGLGLIVMAFWGILFMLMGWLQWSDAFMLLFQVLAVFGVGQIFKIKRQREGV